MKFAARLRQRVRITGLALGLAAGAAAPARAADAVTLQLKWLVQGQFAGYFAAQAKGFYKDAGLAVTIKPGGPAISPSAVLGGGGADVAVDWLPAALAARERGVPLVNIAQVFNRSGMELVCRRDSGVASPADFKGRTLGVWFAGNEYPFLAWMAKLGLSTSGAHPDVTVLKQGATIDPLLQKQAACISAMSYNEYWQLIETGVKPEDLVVFNYEDQGVATLEDGLYTTQEKLTDPAMLDRLARFLKASLLGWQFVIDHPDDAEKIMIEADTAGTLNDAHQKRMIGEIVKLLPGSPHGLGYLEPAAYERTVKELLANRTGAVITRPPSGAWTRAVWDKASK
jgi:NitT/TauT family transport system substrate-binding protein